MVTGISGLSQTIQTKVAGLNLEDGLSAAEAQQAGLTQAEVDAIRAAGITVDADVKIDETGGTATAPATTAATTAASTAASLVTMPAETIDPTATAQLKAEIEAIREDYDLAKAESTELARKIDEKEKEYDALQEELKRAVTKVEDAAIDANEAVSIEVNKIRQKAQDEGWSEDKLKQELSNIGIPSISSEQKTLESVGIEVGNLAKVICELSDLYAQQANTVDELADRWGGFLEVDLNTIYVNTAGGVVVNELGAEGPEVSGAEGISAADMQKFSTMTNDELTQYLSSNEGNALLTAMQGMANEGVSLTAGDCAAIIKNLIAAQDKSTGDVAKFGTEKADNLQVNIINGASLDKLSGAVKEVEKPCPPPPKKSCDPYSITVDGVKYTMILDNGDGKWDTNDILGINDNKDNLFAALKGLESDGDVSNLTGEELAKAGIRLVATNKDGTLAVDDPSKDFDLSKVKSIDMTNLQRSTDNDGNVGTFGNFDMTLADGRTIKGEETFEEMSTLQKLFGAVKNFFDNLGNVASDIISKLKIDADEKEWYSNGIKQKVLKGSEEANATVGDRMRYSDELLDESLRVKTRGAEDYEEPVAENPEEEAVDVSQLTEEEKIELARRQNLVLPQQ